MDTNKKKLALTVIAPIFVAMVGCSGGEDSHDNHEPDYPTLHDAYDTTVNPADYLYVVDKMELDYSNNPRAFSGHLQDYIWNEGIYDHYDNYYIEREQYGHELDNHSITATKYTYYGAIDSSTIYEFDNDGKLTFESIDRNGDGYSDYTSSWHYDSYDFEIIQHEDLNGDGQVDISTRITRASNHDSSHTKSTLDISADNPVPPYAKIDEADTPPTSEGGHYFVRPRMY